MNPVQLWLNAILGGTDGKWAAGQVLLQSTSVLIADRHLGVCAQAEHHCSAWQVLAHIAWISESAKINETL